MSSSCSTPPSSLATTSANDDTAEMGTSGDSAAKINLKRVKTVHMLASNTLSVSQVKEQLLEEAIKVLEQYNIIKTPDDAKAILGTADGYCLKVVGVDEYLTNETLPLYP
jgi:hypothetical protein